MNVLLSIEFTDFMKNVNKINNKIGKRRYNIKLWKTFTDCFNSVPIAAVIDEKILCMHGGLSPELTNLYKYYYLILENK